VSEWARDVAFGKHNVYPATLFDSRLFFLIST
jgi:hypothetical protein